MESVRRALAQSLERGRFSGASAHMLERAWHMWSASRVARPLAVPEGVVTVAIGGATLGGSGKTPLALACARAAAELCTDEVALIGHAYRATPRTARIVTPDDDVAVVGDEALLCARELSPRSPSREASGNVNVIVAPTRQRAIDFAVARGARILVLDGVAQIAPRRADLALLACDAHAPWGNGACPPRGDLKAPVPALLAASDHVVMLSDADIRSRGAWLRDHLVSYADLAQRNLGLVTALARPERVLRRLQSHGVFPRTVIHTSDHGSVSARTLTSSVITHRVEGWLATHKCSIHLRNLSLLPVYVLEHQVVLNVIQRRALHAAIVAGMR